VLPNALLSPSPDAHVPVLAREVGALLDVHPGERVVDCTFGAGGHSRMLARDLDGSGELVAIDRDPSTQPFVDALRATVGTGVQIRPMHGAFASCLRRLLDEDLHAAAVLMDLGMSSMQVDEPGRGFSYTQDAPLDMRMDPSDDQTAATIVNEWGERELAQIFSRYGEERFSRQIARAIVQERAGTPFATTLQLVATVKRAIPTPSRFGHGHPAKRVFQALRIAVNDELGQLEDGLESALALCAPGGRVAVISFHSLEDRMVKQRFVKSAKGCICPPDLPVCGCGRTPEFRLVTHKAVRPNAEEVAANPRSASARLRVVQREVTA
jgi:16S rRNA (cytosine1402-N4)-methyltransferase